MLSATERHPGTGMKRIHPQIVHIGDAGIRLDWKRSVSGGYFCDDDEGNRWHLSENGEVYSVFLLDGGLGQHHTPEGALRNAQYGD